MKINLKTFIYITFILLFLPAFCFMIGKQFIPVYMIPVYLSFFGILVVKPKYFYKIFRFYYKKTPFKFFVWFVLWALFTFLVAAFRGIFFPKGMLNSIIGGLFGSCFLPMLLVMFFIPKYLSVKKFTKFLYAFIWFVFLLGIINEIISYLNIPILDFLSSILANKRLLLTDYAEATIMEYGLHRTNAIFEEPSFFGYFIFVVSPIVYELTRSKCFKLKNELFNSVVKKTIIPMMWISLVLTQSPIFLIFNIIFAIYYVLFVLNAVSYLKKHVVLVSVITIPMIMFFIISFLLQAGKFDVNQTYLVRITNVFGSSSSFEDFVLAEPSLATRIITIIGAIKLGIKNIIFGVGYGNMSYVISNAIGLLNIPLTPELVKFVEESRVGPASTIFIKVFSETALIGTIIFYFTLYSIYKKLKSIVVASDDYLKPVISSFKFFIVLFICSTFYSSLFNDAYLWVLIAFALVLSTYKKVDNDGK